MRRGGKKIFNHDEQKLQELTKLRQDGWAISSLAWKFNCDKKAIRYRLKQLNSRPPTKVAFGIESFVRRTVWQMIPKLYPDWNRQPKYIEANRERRNEGKTYKEYLADSKHKTQPL